MAIPSLAVPTGTGGPMGASAPVEEIVKAATVWSRVFITRSSPDWFTKTLARVPGPLPTVKGDPGTGVRAPVDESMLNDATRLAFDSEANRNRFSLKSVTCSRNEGDAPATVGKGETRIGGIQSRPRIEQRKRHLRWCNTCRVGRSRERSGHGAVAGCAVADDSAIGLCGIEVQVIVEEQACRPTRPGS